MRSTPNEATRHVVVTGYGVSSPERSVEKTDELLEICVLVVQVSPVIGAGCTNTNMPQLIGKLHNPLRIVVTHGQNYRVGR